MLLNADSIEVADGAKIDVGMAVVAAGMAETTMPCDPICACWAAIEVLPVKHLKWIGLGFRNERADNLGAYFPRT